MIDRIVIVGAGSTGRSLVTRLLDVASITLLDSSADTLADLVQKVQPEPAEEPAANSAAPVPAQPRNQVQHVHADGTSRLVLEDLRGELETSTVALVAATGSDRMNLEVCRLGLALRFKPVVAVVIEPALRPAYDELGVHSVVRAQILGDVVEKALRSAGIVVASNVGLGRGELIEVRILASSPAIGQRLVDLHPEGWQVAAIYRNDELVMPTGQTAICLDDRLLLVGDHKLLPHVGEHLRIGLPDFPLRHGPNIVVYQPERRDPRVEAEAELLTLKTRALRLVRMFPGATPSLTEVRAGAVAGTERKQFEDVQLTGRSLEEHIEALLAQRPGLIIVKEHSRGLFQRILGIGGRDSRLCNLSPVPVLFADGQPDIERIVMVIGGGAYDLRTADVAVDLARMLELPLTLLRIDLPDYLAEPESSQDHVEAAIEQRTSLYQVRVNTERREGNPVAELARFVTKTDLCVVARRRIRRDSYSTPDVALRMVHAIACSALVISV